MLITDAERRRMGGIVVNLGRKFVVKQKGGIKVIRI
jgi:hypothetical protein